MPDGVTAARLTLDQLVKVRILLRQLSKPPFLLGGWDIREQLQRVRRTSEVLLIGINGVVRSEIFCCYGKWRR